MHCFEDDRGMGIRDSSGDASRRKHVRRTRRLRAGVRMLRPDHVLVAAALLAALLSFSSPVQANDDAYAAAYDDDYSKNYYKYNYQYYNDDAAAAANDDAAAAGDDAAGDDDAAAAADDQYANGDDDANNNGDDDANNNGNGGDDDYYAGGDDDANNKAADDYVQQQEVYDKADDDLFHWNSNVGFDGVSVMPLSCINYNSGHMIKFQLFDSAQSYQCHFAEISTFVVSISHYMRAYFNYQALVNGNDFQLPADAAYLNCNPLQGFDEAYGIYAKIGCMERETFTSTKLQLILYTDNQCSQPYEDSQTAKKRAHRGYELNGELVSSKVSFKPDFYSCLSCTPDAISNTFNKRNSNWYDDDYISEHGNKNNEENADDDYQYDDQNAVDDLYYSKSDDGNVNNDDDGYWKYSSYNAGDDYYKAADDYYGGRRQLALSTSEANRGVIQAYQDAFWSEYHELQRHLYENNYYDVGDWNMCQRIYKYGVWCDEECRSLDLFRTDMWSASDIFLLAIMCTFLTAMMLLIVAKRLKAQQKARIYGEEHSMPGLPPFAMAIIFFFIMTVIITLAKLKFINETLVFAVVTCILLFIYMLKLTLFENRRPVLLAAPRHDMFDNPLDDHLFE